METVETRWKLHASVLTDNHGHLLATPVRTGVTLLETVWRLLHQQPDIDASPYRPVIGQASEFWHILQK